MRVTRVIGTHMHPDHIGLAGWVCDHHARAAGDDARRMADGQDARSPTHATPCRTLGARDLRRGAGWSDEQIEAASAQRGWAGFRRIVTAIAARLCARLQDGDTLDGSARADWRVVTGSGHSPEHACLLDEAAGVFVAGDQVLPRISPNVSLGVTEPHADPLGEWFASIEKLKQLPADLLVLPGHGDPFMGLHTRLDAMDREHRERLDELEAFLAEPRRAVDCFGRLFRRAIGQDMLGMASGEALAHLRRLEVEGRADREDRDGVWWWRAT